jgi:hypothetical protein
LRRAEGGAKIFGVFRVKNHDFTPKIIFFWGGRTRRAPSLKLEKNMIFWRKIVIFHTKYPKNFRASLRNWKKYDFWRKIVIFHTKYPKNFHASLCSAQFFLSLPPLT